MMCKMQNLIRKAYQIRKKNWSAPAKMTAFIIFCMFMVYSFESIGLLNKERNIDYRLISPEKVIKTLDLSVKKDTIERFEKHIEQVVNLNIKEINEKTKEENVEKIRKIMIEGALIQLSYENCSDALTEKIVKLDDNDKLEFFDF